MMKGKTSEEQYAANIQAAVARLGDVGVDLAQFTPLSVLELGFFPDKFCKYIKVLTSITSDNVIKQTIVAANRAGKCNSAAQMTVKEVVDICRWLRTPTGQASIRDAQVAERLSKQASAGQSVKGVALASALTRQLQDYYTAVKTVRNQHADVDAEAVRDAAVEQLAFQFVPASRFVELSYEQIGLKAYELYLAQSLREGTVPLPYDDTGIAMARSIYSSFVRDRHISDFCLSADVMPLLIEYLQKKILEFDQRYLVRLAKTFRSILAVICGEETLLLSAATETEGNRVDSGVEDPTLDAQHVISSQFPPESPACGKRRIDHPPAEDYSRVLTKARPDNPRRAN